MASLSSPPGCSGSGSGGEGGDMWRIFLYLRERIGEENTALILGLMVIASVLVWLWGKSRNRVSRTRLSEVIPTDMEMETWRKKRLQVFYKAGGICELCGFGLSTDTSRVPDFEVHHIDGDAANYENGNVKLACRSCGGLAAWWHVDFDIPSPYQDKRARALARLCFLVPPIPYDQVRNVFEEWKAKGTAPATFEMACRLAEIGIRREVRPNARNVAKLRKRRTEAWRKR